jgi:ribosomal protein S18 acetylase RimI-like enzyme
MFVVVEGGKKLVGYLLVEGNTFKKKHHCIAIVLAIMEGYRGQGLGSKLIQYIEVWAKEQHIHRIELTVNTLNQSAFDLYTKLGFEIEGIKKHTTLIRGEYTDDYMMAKLI